MKFEQLNINPKLVKATNMLGYLELTSIQEKCIPEILLGKDVVGQSSTGSGKTAAFALPILNSIESGRGIQALILTPTRELCVQVAHAIIGFSKFMHFRVTSVYGGVGIEPQISSLRTADIVVGTPGRILDHIQRRTIDFSRVKFFVLDEADKMFEMGFIDDVEEIISHVAKQRQTLLFSATLGSNVNRLVRKHLRAPVTIKSQLYVDKSLLKQLYYDVDVKDKFSLLVHLLKSNPEGFALVFCATRREADIVADNLKQQHMYVKAIHGGLNQSKRLSALQSLREQNIRVLVCTDVAARGLDIQNVSHVYNYDVPKTSEEYLHRIGRTARMGAEGQAVTLLTSRDHDNFRRVLEDRSFVIQKGHLPQFERVRFNRMQRSMHESHGFRQGFNRQGSGQRSRHSRSHSYGQSSHGHSYGRGESRSENRSENRTENRSYGHGHGAGHGAVHSTAHHATGHGKRFS